MPDTNDGSFDGAAAENDTSPETQRMTMLAVDENTHPVSWCVNGHVVEWLREIPGTRTIASAVARVNPDGSWTSLCVVCGEEAAAQDVQEAA